ncbi:MAG: hypothetical protein AB1918_02305, partial [Pseudomonadota bacterium]
AWDGSTWVALDTRVGQAGWSLAEKRVFDIDEHSVASTRYRLNVSANNGSTEYWGVGEMEMMEAMIPGMSRGQSYDPAGTFYSGIASVCVTSTMVVGSGLIWWYTNAADLFDRDGDDALYSMAIDSTIVVDAGAASPVSAIGWEIDFSSGTKSVRWNAVGAHRYWRLRTTDALENDGHAAATWAVEYSDNGSDWVVAALLNVSDVNSQMREMRILAPIDMTLVSAQAVPARSVPSEARLLLLHEAIDAVTLNTDLVAEVSRDDGTTWTAAPLVDLGPFATSGSIRILGGIADLSAQPSGTAMRWRVRTFNATEQRLHGASLRWS